MDTEAAATPAVSPALRKTSADPTKRLPPHTVRRKAFSPVRVFADHAFAARIWFLVACGSLIFCIFQPYLIINAYRSRERVIVLDGAGTFSISPLLGFEEARELHEAMVLWAVLALFQRNPRGFDYPEVLEKLFLKDAAQRANADRDALHEEFQLKNIHQKPEVFRIEFLQTRENQVLAKVEGQLIRTGVFRGQTLAESPQFTLNLTLVRNPNMAANKRYPLGVWSFDYVCN